MHSVIVQKRRKRSINFTDSDRQVLMNLVQPHLSVIENKRMDKFTSRLKSETWENIKVQYNQLNTEPRTALQLKLFYEANKYRMRRISKQMPDINLSDENNNGKIVKIEVERKTILDALAQTESEDSKKEDSDTNSPQAKIKCVEIEKLQGTRQLDDSGSECNSSDKLSNLPSSPINDRNTDFSTVLGLQPTCLRPKVPLLGNACQQSHTALPSATCDSSIAKQDELHAIRMKILEDERFFRRQEHLKHMEYFEIGIVALKAFLLKQAQSTPLIHNQK